MDSGTISPRTPYLPGWQEKPTSSAGEASETMKQYGAMSNITKSSGGVNQQQQREVEEEEVVHDCDEEMDEEKERLPIHSPTSASSAYHDEEDGLIRHQHTGISGSESKRQSPACHGRCFKPLLLFVVVLLVLLLIVDVAMRTTTMTTTSTTGRRWVPQRDLLFQDTNHSLSTLRYTWDLQNYSLQGLALDTFSQQHEDSIVLLYEVHTLSVRVLQLHRSSYTVLGVKNRRIWTAEDFPPLLDDTPVAHIGGVDLCRHNRDTDRDDELWMATHSDGIDGVGGLIAVDPNTLSYREGRKVLVDYNLDWVACSDSAGVLYFGGFFNVKQIHRVDLETLEPLPDLVVDFDRYPQYAQEGINYVQSASFDMEGQLVLLGDDYQNTIYSLEIPNDDDDDNNNRAVLSSSQGLLLGSETDGITFDTRRNTMLVGYNRQHSHEQVMGMDQMISIIELVQQ